MVLLLCTSSQLVCLSSQPVWCHSQSKKQRRKVKHQQIVSGVSISAYWFSSYVIDMIKYMQYQELLSPLMILAFGIESLVDDGVYQFTWAIFMLFGPANISFTYFLSFMFENSGGAQIAVFFLNMLIGVIGAITLGTLALYSSQQRPRQLAIAWIVRLIPSFTFANGMFLTTSYEIVAF